MMKFILGEETFKKGLTVRMYVCSNVLVYNLIITIYIVFE